MSHIKQYEIILMLNNNPSDMIIVDKNGNQVEIIYKTAPKQLPETNQTQLELYKQLLQQHNKE